MLLWEGQSLYIDVHSRESFCSTDVHLLFSIISGFIFLLKGSKNTWSENKYHHSYHKAKWKRTNGLSYEAEGLLLLHYAMVVIFYSILEH